MGQKKIYYWQFQCNGFTSQVASSDIGAVRVKIGFSEGIDVKRHLLNLEQGKTGF
jgi:hypothetical protein